MKRIISRFKYAFASDVAPVLLELIASNATHPMLHDKRWTLVPVPLHPSRARWRGFNQSMLIAEGLQQSWDFSLIPLLSRIKNTHPQKGSSQRARIPNLDQVFVCIHDGELPMSVLLVDDVATTGSTLQECSKVLKQAGVSEVWGLTLAQTIPRTR